MKDDVPSGTAAIVAALRGAASLLPDSLRLIDDPFGFRFLAPLSRVPPPVARALRPIWFRSKLRENVHLLALRTRVIDDEVLRFVARGGRQIVILGAGFDCRAWRLPLERVLLFEVDHPATQAKKRALVSEPARAIQRFVAWNFERDRMADLPARLAKDGHDARAATLVILEGVTPYLSAEALDATFAAARALMGEGSRLVFTYFERVNIERGGIEARLVRLLGEPYRTAFDPREMAGWLAARRLALDSDVDLGAFARQVLPRREAERLEAARRRVACATVQS